MRSGGPAPAQRPSAAPQLPTGLNKRVRCEEKGKETDKQKINSIRERQMRSITAAETEDLEKR